MPTGTVRINDSNDHAQQYSAGVPAVQRQRDPRHRAGQGCAAVPSARSGCSPSVMGSIPISKARTRPTCDRSSLPRVWPWGVPPARFPPGFADLHLFIDL
jgi:hypothetical protein